MIAFQVGSICATVMVFACLIWLLLRRSEIIIRPSYLFVGFFWIQVQLASALNSAFIYQTLPDPWAYFVLIHLFPLAAVITLPFTMRKTLRSVKQAIDESRQKLSALQTLWPFLILLAIIWTVLAIYLAFVPFNRTGLYATMFAPELADEYRERSMKLLKNPILGYSFAFIEKVAAPLAGAYLAILLVSLWPRQRTLVVFLAILGFPAIVIPTMIYGARGPGAMVVAAFAFTLILLSARRISISALAAAFLVALLPALVIMVIKDGRFSAPALAFQIGNVIDRAMGRNFCDNVMHVLYVQRYGFHGLAAIEKLAPLMGIKPIDAFNVIGKEFYGECPLFGLQFLRLNDSPPRVKQRPTPNPLSEEPVEEPVVDLRETVNAGASFVVMNYTMFGLASVIASFAIVLGLDLLLLAYRRILPVAALAAVGAAVVPILNLCFSMITTVLISKGLLLIPLVAWLLGLLPISRPDPRSAMILETRATSRSRTSRVARPNGH